MAPKLGEPTILQSGPWTGVFTTADPFDTSSGDLHSAMNCYIPDATNGSGAYARPAWMSFEAGGTMGTGNMCATPWRHVMRSGTTYNFVASKGKIFRVDFAANTVTDVTPVAPTISSSNTVRIYMQSYNDTLIVSDGVNKPWYGTNLGATPITGTNIDIDTAAAAWSAYGQPTVFGGSLVFIVNTYAGAGAPLPRVSIVWCEPGAQATGYVQTGYTDFANIIQTSSRPLTAILGTNNGLYYWRDNEIGIAQGIVDGSFASTATYAAVSTAIGCVAPATVQRYSDIIYFADQAGRPQRLPIGGKLADDQMWLQMRSVVDTFAPMSNLPYLGCAAIDAERNLYLCASNPSGAAADTSPTVMYAFDTKTGNYVGIWTVSSGTGGTSQTAGVPIKGLGTVFSLLADATGSDVLGAVTDVFGSSGSLQTYISQIMRPIGGTGYYVDVTRPGVSWPQPCSVSTAPLGYASDVTWNAGQVLTVVQLSLHTVDVTVQTPYTAATLVGTPTPNASSDGTYRVVVGMDVWAARGITVTVAPDDIRQYTTTQWAVERISFPAVPSLAGVQDQ